MREEINYASELVAFTDSVERIFWFYPNGVWDNCKRTYKEALEAYPLEQYKWVITYD